MRRLIIVILVLAAFGLGFLVRGGGPATPVAGTDMHETEPTVWTCSMHPQVQLPSAGACPICFMDLIPLENDTEEDLGPRAVVLTESAAALADIQTAPVRALSTDTDLSVKVRMIGKVVYDETTYRTITAWIPGRIDTLLVDSTGMSVKEGQGLASMYSPDLYAAQVELLDAVDAAVAMADSPDPSMARSAQATVEAARSRMRLWGLSAEQVLEIERSRVANHHSRIPSPLGGVVVHKNVVAGQYVQEGSKLFTIADLRHVWVTLDAYESDIAWLSVGIPVRFTVVALPGRSFSGDVVFIDPVLNERTRTVGVRIEVDNAAGELKPGMLVHATADADMSEFISRNSGTGVPLVIPVSSALVTGERAVVYVKILGRDKPTFEGREIVLGPRAGDFYVVKSGLTEGEIVVTHGNFKLDSALQIQAKPSMMSPDGGVAPPGHHHGDGMPDMVDPTPRTDVPEAFRSQLRPLLDGYLVLQAAFSADDDAGARVGVDGALAAIHAVDMKTAGPAHEAWMADSAALTGVLKTMATAKDIADRRGALQKLTDLVWNVMIRYGYADERTVRQFHCPMAYDGKGGDWIQLDPVTANPYFGSMMLKCGNETGVLSRIVAADSEGSQ